MGGGRPRVRCAKRRFIVLAQISIIPCGLFAIRRSPTVYHNLRSPVPSPRVRPFIIRVLYSQRYDSAAFILRPVYMRCVRARGVGRVSCLSNAEVAFRPSKASVITGTLWPAPEEEFPEERRWQKGLNCLFIMPFPSTAFRLFRGFGA